MTQNQTRFIAKLNQAWGKSRSCVCVGLDPVLAKLPDHFEKSPRGVLAFCREIIDATVDLACAYKPNLAYFLSLGPEGYAVLQQVCAAVPKEVAVLLDAKFGDVGHTSQAYAQAAFEVLEADAVTLNPYLGEDGLSPFLAYPDRFLFVLARTSNESASAVQEVQVKSEQGRETPLYHYISQQIQAWAGNRAGFVVGATVSNQVRMLRKAFPQAWMLLPGIGAQGGLPADVLPNAVRHDGRGVVVPVSRSVLFASRGKDFAEKSRTELEKLHCELRSLTQT